MAAEMADLAKALDKLDVNPAAAASLSPQKQPHEEETTMKVTSKPSEKPEAEETSPPPEQEEAKPSSKPQEEAASSKQQEEAASSKPQEETASPPEEQKAASPLRTSEASPPQEPPQDKGPKEKTAQSSPQEADDDLLEFTSASEGEAESSSAWELVPGERQIARKKGVKSDSELDDLMKKVIKEAEGSPPSSSKPLTSLSSSSKAAVTTIPEEPAEEIDVEKSPSEPDFSFEDGPEPAKDVVTTGMGRKDLLKMDDAAVTSDAEGDKEMVDISHPSSGKRKGRPASHGAKKRALPPKSPRTASVGAGEGGSAKTKAASPPPSRASSANKMPRSASPQAKADSVVASKPPVKPPPKGITPITPVAVAKPPPKAITSADAAEREARAKAAAEEKAAKLRAEKEAKALADWKKAQDTVAERQAAAASAPPSPPIFTTDWSKITSREEFLKETSDAFRLDPNSAEGFNHHVSSYYYVSSNWGVSHPQSYSSLMLKSDSRQSHRWTCVHCRAAHPDVCDHKTVEEGIIHWWRHHCHHSSWVWCEKAGVFNVTTADICKAVLDVDMSERPLPLGGAFHMLPNNLPSHPKGLDKRLFKHPYNKHLTPANHPSEQGLPWNQHLEELPKKEPEMELTNWQWDLFFGRVLQGNTDVLCFLIHPFTSLKDYVEARKVWHARSFTAPGANEIKGELIDVEQHAFMIVLLKVLTTKADSHLMPPGQIDIVRRYLEKYEGDFADRAQEALTRIKRNIGEKDLNYFASVKEYALSAHNLDTPVNIWRIPYPAGHAPVFASPTRLSLVTATS